MQRSYDVIATVYDKLAKLFIGKALRKAQVYLLRHILQDANILLAGGGTGWILEEITSVHPKGLRIDYVDVSLEMLALSRQRHAGLNKVNFIHQSITDEFPGNNYDVIITPFLLDNFSNKTVQKVFASLHQKLKVNGVWLYTDFQIAGNRQWLKKIILFIMYSFFRAACNIEAKQLPDVTACFTTYHYRFIHSKTFLHRFIITAMYKKI